MLVTARVIIEFLSKKQPPPLSVYLSEAVGIVTAGESKLGRTLIPFYRHYKYVLENPKFGKYKAEVQGLVR